MDGIFDWASLGAKYKEHHIINEFIFPGSSKSAYGWDSFRPGELVAFRTGGEEDLLVPCLLLRGYSPLDKEDKEGEEEEGEGAGAPEAPTPASTLLIYCHANSEDLGSIYACAHWISRMLGVHVLVPEYPGYGLCEGRACEASVNAAVLGACRWAREALGWDREHLLIYGRSIGTGPAIKAAELGLVGGVVLVSPYTSIRDIVETHVGSVMSLVTLGASDWHSAKNMRNVRCPVLIIHGTADEIIPASHSKALHHACSAPKRLILLDKIGHQEMELLYALVQASPGMFCLYDSPKPLLLSHLAAYQIDSKGPKDVPVYASSLEVMSHPSSLEVSLEMSLERGEHAGSLGEGGQLGSKVIHGKSVFVL